MVYQALPLADWGCRWLLRGIGMAQPPALKFSLSDLQGYCIRQDRTSTGCSKFARKTLAKNQTKDLFRDERIDFWQAGLKYAELTGLKNTLLIRSPQVALRHR